MAFSIIGTVKSVLLDSSPSTFFEVVILDAGEGEQDYSGDSFTDVDSILIEGPNGVLNFSKDDFDFHPKIDQYFLQLPGFPAVGTYNFSVTINGVTEHYENTQGDIIKISLPPLDSLIPHKDDIFPAGIINFSWYRIKGGWYYAIDIRDTNVNSLGTITHGNVNISNSQYELTPGSYIWRLIIMDSPNWRNMNNRAHTKWVSFTVI